MGDPGTGWEICSQCGAGRPAGARVCPRCRLGPLAQDAPTAEIPARPAHSLTTPTGRSPRSWPQPDDGLTLKRGAAGSPWSVLKGPLQGALWAVLATGGAGAAYGTIFRLKECSVTADALTSAIVFAAAYIVVYGVPASALGVLLGWALSRPDTPDLRSQAGKPQTWTDDLA